MVSDKPREVTPEQWTPLPDVEAMADQLRSAVDQTFAGFTRWPAVRSADPGWAPPVDVEETDDAYLLDAELPGVERDDVNIELVGNELAITGEVHDRERTGVVRRRARRSGHFDYRVTLPAHVDAELIEASLRGGILHVRVPKSEPAQRRRIELQAD